MELTIRRAIKSDLEALAELFADSVGQIAPQQYSPQQVLAWANSASDLESFGRSVFQGTIFVAETKGLLLGFGGIQDTGYLSHLYVRGDYHRQGIGSSLLARIIKHARVCKLDRLYTEASEFSKLLFLKSGWELYAEEDVTRNNITFHRYLMQVFL